MLPCRSLHWAGAILALLALLLSGCAPGGRLAGGPAGTPTPLARATTTPSVTAIAQPPTPTPPPTPAPPLPPASPLPPDVTYCGNVSEFAGAQITELYAMNFPEDGVVIGEITSPPNSLLQVVSYDACMRLTPGANAGGASAMDQVLATLGVVGRGWIRSRTFPMDGQQPIQCSGNQQCFNLDPQTYALFEQARMNNSGLGAFRLRIALAQPVIPCDPVLFPRYTYPPSISPYYAATIPLPQGTRISIGRGSSQGITMYFCSPESAAAITDFMQQQLPANGWQSLSVSGRQYWKITTSGAPTLYMRVNPITDPRDWSELEYFAGFAP